jgi:hypothetical protein
MIEGVAVQSMIRLKDAQKIALELLNCAHGQFVEKVSSEGNDSRFKATEKNFGL